MNTPTKVFRFGPFSFDSAQQELRRRTQRVRLSVSLLKLLTLFLERPGELITREEIALRLWKDSGTIDIVTGINTAVRRLRAQLDDDPSAPTYIETVIGIGYRFIAHVEESQEASSLTSTSGVPGDPPLIQQPTATEPPVPGELPPTLETSSKANIEAPSESQQSFRLKRHRFISTMLVLGVSLLLLALGAVVVKRLSKPPASLGETTHRNLSLVQVTFNDEKNLITVEAVSPKGDLVAYGDRYGVSVHAMDSGANRLLTSPSSFLPDRMSWHPDEDWVLVSGFDLTSRRSQAWAVFLHGETPRLLLDDAGLAVVSPDGNQIAYTRAENTELWLADGVGQNAHLLAPKVDGQSVTCLLWSPRGDRLIADRVSGAGSTERAGSAPVDAPPRSIYESIDVRNGKLLSRQENIKFKSGFLLNDGRFFFPTIGDFTGTKIMVVNTDPSTGEFLSHPQPVSPNLVPVMGGESNLLSASGRGDLIGAVSTIRPSDVYVAKLHWPGPALEDVTRLTDGSANYYPDAWTPDGNAVLFDRNNFAPSIGKQRLGDPKMEVVAQSPNIAAMARYSPDGNWILYTEFAESPTRVIGIFRVPSGGGKPRQLYTTGAVDEFSCPISYTGSCVMRETNGKKEFAFFALDPVQGMQQEVGRTHWNPTMLGDWSVSPDSSIVAMANHDPENPGIQLIHLSPNRAIQPSTIPVIGFGEVREATWAPDAKGFFVETKTTTGYNLLYVDLAGHAKLLRQSPIAIWGIPSRDGKQLAFPGLTVTSNVWVGRTALP